MPAERRWFVVAATVSLSACLIDLDGLSVTPSVAPDSDAAATDASPDSTPDGGPDADVSPGVVVFSEGFETAGPTMCSPYNSYHGSARAGSPAHGGAQACLVCRTASGTGGFTLDGIDVASPRAGERYAAEAWVRVPDGNPPAPSVFLKFRIWADNGAGAEITRSGPEVALDQTWRRASLEWTMPMDNPKLNSYTESTGPQDACFLIDDIVIRRLP